MLAALHILGVVARRTDRLPLAIAVLHDAVQLEPDVSPIHCELGLALSAASERMKRPRIIAARPRSTRTMATPASIWRRRSIASSNPRRRSGGRGGQRNSCRAMRSHASISATFCGNSANWNGPAAFQEAICLDPSFANAHWNDACCRLLAGDFARGWPEYEWREAAGEVQLDRYPQPRWRGESLAGATILVHAEQGIGDEILFASCLPEMIARSGQCVVVCEPRLEKLFARSFPEAAVHGIVHRKDRAGSVVAERIDKQIPAGSLPLHLRPSRASFPQRPHFLKASDEMRAWRAARRARIRIEGRHFVHTGGQPSERRKRTTDLEGWRDLFAVSGVQFVNLQYGDCDDEIAAARRDLGVEIHDFQGADPLVDLDVFAAKIAALDLVISVGNATVHLAGGLGVPTWALLPKVPGWRWMIAGEQSLWYSSVRLIRQSERGNWQPVFAEAAPALAARAAGARGEMPSQIAISSAAPPRHAMMSEGDRNAATVPSAAFDAAALFEAGRKSFDVGDAAAAEASCRRVLDHAPRHVPALNLLGQIVRRSGRLELAIRTLRAGSRRRRGKSARAVESRVGSARGGPTCSGRRIVSPRDRPRSAVGRRAFWPWQGVLRTGRAPKPSPRRAIRAD